MLDPSGPWPALHVRPAGQSAAVALNGRRNPIGDAERELMASLRGHQVPVVVLIGLGLGYTLDALERLGWATRVMALEPLAEALPHFHARREWSSWLGAGRLEIVEGPDYADAGRAWAALEPATIPPVIVSRALARACPELVIGARAAVFRARHDSALDPRRPDVGQSMLHAKVLTVLEHYAATVTGAIVEIGAYVGGATVAMTRGIRDSGRATPMITIEPGGSYPTHPHLPSDDIFGDLQGNLRRHGLEPYVNLLRGTSSDPAIVDLVRGMLAERGLAIGLLCIDADGVVQRDLDLFLPMCARGCIIAVDDYSGPPQNTKTEPTRKAVDALVASGRARRLDVIGWGTWLGIYTP
jgi:predicted O-methyltransferase YrrM